MDRDLKKMASLFKFGDAVLRKLPKIKYTQLFLQ